MPLSTASLVIIPTFNEIEALPVTLDALSTIDGDFHILIVDDASPDGTGDYAALRAENAPRLHVLHRTGKGGLGAAYIAGFHWGLERGYEILCEMDADGSHRAKDLPQLLAAVEAGADLAIGSRWVPGGAVVNWPLRRRVLSVGGNVYVRGALGLKLNDATAGFRAYRAELIRELGIDSVASHGYCFQVDMAWRAAKLGATIVEVPIVFVERELGDSKMSGHIVREALIRTTAWGLQHRGRQARQAGQRLTGLLKKSA